jgi:hypothetical protein
MRSITLQVYPVPAKTDSTLVIGRWLIRSLDPLATASGSVFVDHSEVLNNPRCRGFEQFARPVLFVK